MPSNMSLFFVLLLLLHVVSWRSVVVSWGPSIWPVADTSQRTLWPPLEECAKIWKVYFVGTSNHAYLSPLHLFYWWRSLDSKIFAQFIVNFAEKLESFHYMQLSDCNLAVSCLIDIHTMGPLGSVHADLDLQSCLQLKEAAFLHIGELQHLKRLNLYSTETSRNLLDTIRRCYTSCWVVLAVALIEYRRILHGVSLWNINTMYVHWSMVPKSFLTKQGGQVELCLVDSCE